MLFTTTVADTGYAPAVVDPEPTPQAAADTRTVARAKVAYLYRQGPCELRKDGGFVRSTRNAQWVERGRRARYRLEEGRQAKLSTTVLCENVGLMGADGGDVKVERGRGTKKGWLGRRKRKRAVALSRGRDMLGTMHG